LATTSAAGQAVGMARTLPVNTLVAFNTATASENKIHDDEVAGALGFGGGLVPGVDVYAYLCQPAVAHWGRDFLTRGRASTRFDTPTYDGERIEVRSTVDDDGVLRAGVHPAGAPADDRPAATLEARLEVAGELPTPPEVGTATRADPADRPPASPRSLTPGTVLGTFAFRSGADERAAYLTAVRDEASPVVELGVVHPGALLRLANTVLSQTVLLGPWIHVGSEIHNYGPVEIDTEIEVRGVVTANFERKGHRFVDLDVVLVGPDGSTRSWIEHTAIYEPRQLRDLPAS
jgi:acyl dehydratase